MSTDGRLEEDVVRRKCLLMSLWFIKMRLGEKCSMLCWVHQFLFSRKGDKRGKNKEKERKKHVNINISEG